MSVKKGRIYDIVVTALITAVMCVASMITIPVGTVPVTFQTFVIYIACAVIGTKKSVVSVLLYLIIGFVGLPVFSGFRGGIGVLAGATGGYIFGFILTALVSGLIIGSRNRNRAVLFTAFLAGTVCCYVTGTLWYAFVYLGDLSVQNIVAAFSACVLPFIIPDIIKMVAASVVSKSLIERGILNENNRPRS